MQHKKSTYRILAADKLAEQGLEWIRSQADADLTDRAGIKEDELAQIVGQYDGMIVRSGVKVTAKVLENPGRLKVIARAGVGVDNIDVEAATRHGILVVNTAEANTTTTAEHAFALMLAMARQIGPAYKTMSDGGWDRNKFKGRQLSGKTLGIVGFGRIGQAVAERALAFHMDVVAYDPFINAETAMDGRVKMFRQFTDLAPHADVLSFHVPLNAQTRGMLNSDTFKLCRQGVMLVNAARGGVIDEQDLIEALDSGQCGGAALDVFTSEPLPADHPLRQHPKVLTTPHLGASTIEAQEAVSIDAAVAVLSYLRGEGVKGAVNAAGLRLDLSPQQHRFADLIMRMSRLISPLVDQALKSVTLEVFGDEVVSASETLMRIALAEILREHVTVPLNIVNARHTAEQRGIETRVVKVDEGKFGPQLVLELASGDKPRRIIGRVYDDLMPRIIEINGYNMDMIPAGPMLLLQNEDRPGMIGLVGNELGQAGVNIADMTISRRNSNALMVLKLDIEAPESLLDGLKRKPGILRVVKIRLPETE